MPNSNTGFLDVDVNCASDADDHRQGQQQRGQSDIAALAGGVRKATFNTGASRTQWPGLGPRFGLKTGNAASFTGTSLDWIFGASPAAPQDKEDWVQVDGGTRWTAARCRR